MRPASQPPVYPLSNFVPDPGIVRLLPEPVAREYLAVPLRVEAGELVVASANPRTAVSRKRLARAARQPIHSLTAIYPDVREALDLAYNRMTPPPQEAVAAELPQISRLANSNSGAVPSPSNWRRTFIYPPGKPSGGKSPKPSSPGNWNGIFPRSAFSSSI